MSEAHDRGPRPVSGLRLVRTPIDSIDRARLFRRLDRATRRAVVLLHGYAGSGKSVLARSWLASRGYTDQTSGWVDCSSATIAADVDRAFAAVSGVAAVRGRPPVVVVDQLDRVGAEVPHQILDTAAHYPDVGLIVVSRGWPQMRVGHLSARGDLTVIGADELAFTADEVAQLWHLRRGTIDPASARQLWELTRGWPVVVQITTSSVDARVDEPRLRALASFFSEEMLDPLDDEGRRALEAAAVNEWSTPELITSITGLADTAALVDELSRAGMPIFCNEQGQLVMHPSFRRHLLAQQSIADPDGLAESGRRAARWMAANGHELSALQLAVAAGDEAQAMELLRQEFLRHLFSHTGVLAEVLDSMPPAWQARHGFIPVLKALAHAARTGTNLNAVLAVMAENLPPHTTGGEVSLDSLAVIGIRLAQRRLADGDPDLALDEADRLQDLIPQLSHQQRTGRRAELALFHCQYGENLLLAGRLRDAKRVLVTARTSAELARLDWLALEAGGSLAMVEALIGQVAVADQLADEALGLAHTLGLGDTTLVSRAHLAKAMVALLTSAGSAEMMGCLARFDACYQHKQREFGGLAAQLEAMATLLAGDPVGALAVVTAYRRTHRCATGALAEAMLHMAAINCTLAMDDIDQAQGELDRMLAAPALPEVIGAETFHARLLVSRGDVAGAWATILDSLADRDPLHPLPAVVQLRTAGLVAHLVGEHEQEVALAARATALADQTGMQPSMLQAMAQGSVPVSTNPLTEAQRLVLASLRPGDTIAAAAARMFVSVNTYKTHLRKSYRKLGVTSRDDAVAMARAYGWISTGS